MNQQQRRAIGLVLLIIAVCLVVLPNVRRAYLRPRAKQGDFIFVEPLCTVKLEGQVEGDFIFKDQQP